MTLHFMSHVAHLTHERPRCPMLLSEQDRNALTKWAHSTVAPYRVATRAKALLMAGDGMPNSRIAAALDISRPAVLMWRKRFLVDELNSVRGARLRRVGATVFPACAAHSAGGVRAALAGAARRRLGAPGNVCGGGRRSGGHPDRHGPHSSAPERLLQFPRRQDDAGASSDVLRDGLPEAGALRHLALSYPSTILCLEGRGRGNPALLSEAQRKRLRFRSSRY